MAKVNETGHAINVANLKKIILFLKDYGPVYNPSKQSIKIAELDQLSMSAETALQNVINNTTAYNQSVNERYNAFSTLKPLSTRLINAFATSDVSKNILDDAKGFNRKIQGTRAAKKIIDTFAPDTSISTSQQSYQQQVQHFKKFVALLENTPSYNPNENDLKVTTLTAFANQLEALNSNVNTNTVKLSTARMNRNEVLYNESTGIHICVQDIKKYVKSLFGSTSPQYKQISNIAVTNKR